VSFLPFEKGISDLSAGVRRGPVEGKGKTEGEGMASTVPGKVTGKPKPQGGGSMISTTVAPPVRRLLSLTLVLGAVAVVALVAARPASAQLPPLPPVDQTVEAVEETVNQTVGTATDVVSGTTQAAGNAATQVVGGETGQQVTGSTAGIAGESEKASETVGNTVGQEESAAQQPGASGARAGNSTGGPGSAKSQAENGGAMVRTEALRVPRDCFAPASSSEPAEAIAVASNEVGGGSGDGLGDGSGDPPWTEGLVPPIPEATQGLLLVAVAALLAVLGLGALGYRFLPVRQASGPRLFLPPTDR
jgi:hypothetical protein